MLLRESRNALKLTMRKCVGAAFEGWDQRAILAQLVRCVHNHARSTCLLSRAVKRREGLNVLLHLLRAPAGVN
jgi:hypothetical protein